MTFLVETVPTLEAAEERLAAIVGRIQRAPTERVNILTGSNVQRIYYRRMLAGRLGATANVRLFTPIDLAAEIRGAGAPPVRLPLPEGGDVLLVEAILHRLQGQRGLRRLNPAIRGVSEAVGAALTDLREGAIGAAEYRAALRRTDDPKLHDLGAVYQAFEEEPPFLDRPAVFQTPWIPHLGRRGSAGTGRGPAGGGRDLRRHAGAGRTPAPLRRRGRCAGPVGRALRPGLPLRAAVRRHVARGRRDRYCERRGGRRIRSTAGDRCLLQRPVAAGRGRRDRPAPAATGA